MQKYCENSRNCPWGDVFTPNRCAYNLDTDDFECPMILQTYELNMDKICKDLASEIHETQSPNDI